MYRAMYGAPPIASSLNPRIPISRSLFLFLPAPFPAPFYCRVWWGLGSRALRLLGFRVFSSRVEGLGEGSGSRTRYCSPSLSPSPGCKQRLVLPCPPPLTAAPHPPPPPPPPSPSSSAQTHPHHRQPTRISSRLHGCVLRRVRKRQVAWRPADGAPLCVQVRWCARERVCLCVCASVRASRSWWGEVVARAGMSVLSLCESGLEPSPRHSMRRPCRGMRELEGGAS